MHLKHKMLLVHFDNKIWKIKKYHPEYVRLPEKEIFMKPAWMLHNCLIIHLLCTGYVLSCLPFISEDSQKICDQIELIKNLKLKPDFIITIKVEFSKNKLSSVSHEKSRCHNYIFRKTVSQSYYYLGTIYSIL